MTQSDSARSSEVVAIGQLINKWAKEIDDNNGVGVGPMLTLDCTYSVPGQTYEGREQVVRYYEDRLASLRASPSGVPVHRHVISNLCVDFTGPDSAEASFVMVYYSQISALAGNSNADPVLIGDGDMVLRREADGVWRIARLDTEAVLVREGNVVR